MKYTVILMSFQTISSINYGYTQNLAKNSWLRLRRDFLPDINKNLNILALTILDFSIWFLDKCLVVYNGQFYTTKHLSKIKC
jgi:hypothetical protein